MKFRSAFLVIAVLTLSGRPAWTGQGQLKNPSQSSASDSTHTPAAVPTFKVAVNLVLVEVTVRDRHGQIVDGLKRDDFEIFEDGAEERIRYFSRDELPLALALVIDRSTSIAAVLEELREAASNTLALLKPEDQVALFTFADQPKLAIALTKNRDAITDEIPAILVGGGTDINDALVDAASYLGKEAPGRQHALILVSDNEATDPSQNTEEQIIQTALKTEASIYSIEIGFQEHGRRLFHPLAESSFDAIRRIARETGGEVVELRTAGSVENAMDIVISRLKQRYTLGYISANQNMDGAFRTIEVRIAGRSKHGKNQYKIFTRRGYYAPTASRGSPAPPPNPPR